MKDWLDWIISDLSMLFRTRSKSFDANRRLVRVHISRQGVIVSNGRQNGVTAELSEIEASDDIRKMYSGKCHVHLDRSLGLERQFAPFILPASKRHQMAEMDMSVSTPLAEGEACIFMPGANANIPFSTYMAIKRTTLTSHISRLIEAGLHPTKFTIDGKDFAYQADHNVLASLNLIPKWRLKFRRLNFAISFLVLIGVFGTIGHLYLRQTNALNEMGEELLSAQNNALEVRKEHEDRKARLVEIESVRKDRFQRYAMVSVLEQLSKTVPDSAWLTSIDISDENIILNGFAKSAPQLVSEFSKSPMFSNPALTGRVLKDSQVGRDRFSIKMNLVAVSQ